MPTYRILPSGKVNAMVRLVGHKAKTKTFTCKSLAKSWAEELEQSLKVEDKDKSLQALSELYLKTQLGRGGYESAKYRLRNVCARIDKTIPDITSQDVAKYKNERLLVASSTTVRTELQILSRLLKFARLEHGIQNTNPFDGFVFPTANAPRDIIISKSQYKLILDDISPKIKPLVQLAWETSMRRSELLSIRQSAINWKAKTLRLIETKNGHSRDVPLNSNAIAVLKEQLKCTNDDLLFNLKAHSISRAFKRSCDRLNIKGVCFHSLRHTAITRYANRGLSTVQLQVISGHRDITMLSRYTHLKATDIVDLME